MKKVQFSNGALAIFKTVFDGEDDTFVRLSDLRETFSEVLESEFESSIEEMIKSGFVTAVEDHEGFSGENEYVYKRPFSYPSLFGGMVESFTKVYALIFNMYPAEIRNAGFWKA